MGKYMHTYMEKTLSHTYIHTYISIYIHTYIHTYIYVGIHLYYSYILQLYIIYYILYYIYYIIYISYIIYSYYLILSPSCARSHPQSPNRSIQVTHCARESAPSWRKNSAESTCFERGFSLNNIAMENGPFIVDLPIKDGDFP